MPDRCVERTSPECLSAQRLFDFSDTGTHDGRPRAKLTRGGGRFIGQWQREQGFV
jgi:hypothetical protein